MILLCLVFLGMIGYFGSRLYLQWDEYRQGEQIYEELVQYIDLETAPAEEPTQQKEKNQTTPEQIQDTPEPTSAPDNTVWPAVDFAALQKINPDVVAWIYVEGTNINYPVVRGSDNSYYLNHLVDGTYNSAGSIFMDYRNERDLTDRNTILYGHHMQNNSMFNQITNYKSQEFYDQHPTCLLMTPDGNYKIVLIAGYVTDMNSDAWKIQFESDEEFSLWLDNAVSRSTFISAAEPAAQDRVVTFSTCTYEYNDARYVLVGILK